MLQDNPDGHRAALIAAHNAVKERLNEYLSIAQTPEQDITSSYDPVSNAEYYANLAFDIMINNRKNCLGNLPHRQAQDGVSATLAAYFETISLMSALPRSQCLPFRPEINGESLVIRDRSLWQEIIWHDHCLEVIKNELSNTHDIEL